MELNVFSDSEIAEISSFVQVYVHHTILARVYVLSQNPIDKATNFITIFRIIQSCSNYVSKGLNSKIKGLLQEAEDVFNELYPLVVRYENMRVDFGKARILDKIISITTDFNKNKKIDFIVDAFLVFGEKIELNKIDDYMGLDLESDQGKDAMKDIRKTIDNSAV